MKKSLVYNFSGDIDEISHLFPSERLATIAAVIRGCGRDACIVDRANLDDISRFGPEFMQNLAGLTFCETNDLHRETVEREAEAMLARDADCMFVNLWRGTGLKFTLDLVKVMKSRRPSLRVFGFGQKVDEFRESILDVADGCLDGLISGLGYNAVSEIVEGKLLAEIPNTLSGTAGQRVVTRSEVINPDDYPAPDYAGEIYEKIGMKVPVFGITLSNQACPNRCAFCIRPQNYGHVVRRKAIGGVMQELTRCHLEHGATHFRVEDSTPPRNALTDLSRAILESDLAGKVTLSAFSRVDLNAVEDFGMLKEAGFLSLFFGLETLDDDNLRRLKKGTTFPSICDTLSKAHGAGIRTVGSFIFPTPGETRSSMEATLNRITELAPFLDSVVVLPAGVQPNTDWALNPEKYGIKLGKNYITEGIIYPVRYLVPIRQWKPFPFSYALMDKSADEVTFDDIITVQEEFLLHIREELALPGIPDIYFLMADKLKKDPKQTLQAIVTCMIQRDYEGMNKLFLS